MKREAGFTLMELLITLAVGGIIFTAVGSAIYQLSTVSGYGNDKLSVNHDLQNAAYWFTLDGQSALKAEAGPALSYYLPLERTVTYSLAGEELLRTDGSSSLILARNITSAIFSSENRLVSMELTASPGGRSDIYEKRSFQVYLRAP